MSRRKIYYGVNRYVCDVLEELRKCGKTSNYSMLPSLVEEIQVMVNRMEASLADVDDIQKMQRDKSKLKKEVRKLEAEINKLDKKAGKKK